MYINIIRISCTYNFLQLFATFWEFRPFVGQTGYCGPSLPLKLAPYYEWVVPHSLKLWFISLNMKLFRWNIRSEFIPPIQKNMSIPRYSLRHSIIQAFMLRKNRYGNILKIQFTEWLNIRIISMLYLLCVVYPYLIGK